MNDIFEIMLGAQSIGMVEVKREGLYYRFRCRCSLSGEVMHQLIIKCGENEYSLGILVPVGDKFGIDTRLPIKKIGEGDFSFYVTPRHPDIGDKFVPICADEPFSYLEKLQSVHLDVKNGVVGIKIIE